MNAAINSNAVGTGVKLVVCAALALATTAFTTQSIVESAGQAQYGLAPAAPAPAPASADGESAAALVTAHLH